MFSVSGLRFGMGSHLQPAAAVLVVVVVEEELQTARKL